MLKLKKKIISSMICIAMLGTLAAGCSSGNNKVGAGAGTPADAQKSTAVEAASSDSSTKKEEGSKRISFPYTGEKVKLRGLWCNHNNRKNDTVIYNEYLKKIGNIEIDWEQATWADYGQKINLYYSSNDVPDVAICGGPVDTAGKYGPSGIFVDYEKYKDYMPNLQELVKKYDYLNLTLDKDGHRYAIPTSLDGILTEDWAMLGWFYNKTLLAKYNLAVPKSMDELVAVSKELKAKDPEVIPLIAGEMGDLTGSLMPLFGVNSEGIEYDFNKKEWQYTPLGQTQTYKRVIQLANTLWKEKLLDPELATDKMDRIVTKMTKGKWAFQFCYITFYNDNFFSKNAKIDWEPAPMLPPSVDGKSYLPYTQTFDGNPWWGIVSGSATKYPELVCSLIDYSLGSEMSDLLNWGIENVTYKKDADGKKSYMPDVKLPSNPGGTKELIDLGLGRFNHILFKMSDLESTKLQTYGKFELEAQKFIDDAYANKSVIPFYRARAPQFTQEELDKNSSITTPIDTYVNEEKLKFVMGEKSMDKWDEFIKKITTLGDMDSVIKTYNSKPKFELAPR